MNECNKDAIPGPPAHQARRAALPQPPPPLPVQPPAHREGHHVLLTGSLPILPSHLKNLIYRRKKSSSTKLRAFCCRAEPLSGTTESLICVTYKINYRNSGTAGHSTPPSQEVLGAERAPWQQRVLVTRSPGPRQSGTRSSQVTL